MREAFTAQWLNPTRRIYTTANYTPNSPVDCNKVYNPLMLWNLISTFLEQIIGMTGRFVYTLICPKQPSEQTKKLYDKLIKTIFTAANEWNVSANSYDHFYSDQFVISSIKRIQDNAAEIMQYGSDKIRRLYMGHHYMANSARGAAYEESYKFIIELFITMIREIDPKTRITKEELASLIYSMTTSTCSASPSYKENFGILFELLQSKDPDSWLSRLHQHIAN
jgi:hypothetical protein